MEFMLFVDQREESSKQQLKVTLRQDGDDLGRRYHITLWLDVAADPLIRDLAIGDRVRMQLAPAAEAHPDWTYLHVHQAELIAKDGWMCEAHPGTEWPHGGQSGCAGPGMPWSVEGRAAVEQLINATEQRVLDQRQSHSAQADDEAFIVRD